MKTGCFMCRKDLGAICSIGTAMRRLVLRQTSRALAAVSTEGAFKTVPTAARSAGPATNAATCYSISTWITASRDTPGSWRSQSTVAAPSPTRGIQPFRLAQTGEGIKECELIQWFVKEGDEVEEFGRICEVQSDKATVEITSPYAGTIRKLHHKAGDVVQVGEILADIHLAGTPASAPDEGLATPCVDESPAQPPLSAASASASASLGQQLGSAGKVLTSPAVRALAHEHGLDLSQVPATGPGGRVTKTDILAYLESLEASPSTISEELTRSLPTTAEKEVHDRLPPHHAHIAQPVHAAASAAPAAHPAGAAAAAGGAQLPPPPLGAPAPLLGMLGPEGEQAPAPTVVPLRGYRKAMVRSMEAAGRVPHFHYCDEVEVGALVELREGLKGDAGLGGTKLTFVPFFMKAAAIALQEFPLVNSSLAPDESAILQHNSCNIGIAMATPYGLVVPNIKNVQGKSIGTIAQELAQLQRAAAENKLRQEDIKGGTFTLSNIGTIGGTYATPLVNPPEAAIMALGRIQRLPRFAADGVTVIPADVLSISLGADHRIVDGASLAGFAKAWRHYVESPGAMLLHLR